MDTISSEEYKGYTINIVPDEIGESPREWDNLGVMLCWHRNYDLGDIKASKAYDPENYNDKDELYKAIAERENVVLAIPLRLYDHSGITMYCADDNSTYHQHEAWDSGQVGWIVARKADVLKEYSVKRITKAILAKVEHVLRSEVKTYDTYITGGVVGYQVTKAGEDIDSCYGYYSVEDAIAEAKGIIDYEAEEAEKKHEAQVKAWITHNVPLTARI